MSVRAIEAEVSIKSGVSADVTIGREVIRTIYEEPILESLSVTENGVYEPADGVDGFSDVSVLVPERIPVTESLSVTENGTYEPEEGVDGYSDVTVNVPGKIPVLESLNVIANGSYFPEEGVDGFDEVLVNVPTEPEKFVASGSFVKQGTGVTYTLDTHSTKWKRLLIKPHEFPYTGMATSALSRAIMTKYIDLELDAMITAFMSAAGNAYNAGSYRRISTSDDCDVTDGVVRMTGEQAYVGKWINGKQYDWWAWTDTPIEPEDQNIIEGEFEATETGVLTIDIPYAGDDFPKMIIIHSISGIMSHSDGFLENTLSYAINLITAIKVNDTEPSYTGADGGSSNQMRTNAVYHQSGMKYSSITPSTAYIFSSESNEGLYGANGSIRMPNNKTMKIFVSSVRSGSSTFLAANVKYKYQVFY